MSDNAKDTVVCTMCVLCLREDYGYSNYTTEGTNLSCLAGLNPELDGKEEPWSEKDLGVLAQIVDRAKSCPKFREGTPAWLDVDGEHIPYNRAVTLDDLVHYTDDQEAAQLLLKRFCGERPDAS